MDTAEQLYKTAQHYIGQVRISSYSLFSSYRLTPLSRFQVIELLATTITKDEYLQHTSTRSAGSTLGKHLRHLHDHYRLLLDAIPASNSSPSSDDTLNVNYDVRLRNGDAEVHHDACVESFVYLRERMKRDTKEGKGIPSSRPVRLTAIIPEKVVVESSKPLSLSLRLELYKSVD